MVYTRLIVPQATDSGELHPELRPSMARAPKLRKKKDILRTPRALAGVHYEVYVPARDNRDGVTNSNFATKPRQD